MNTQPEMSDRRDADRAFRLANEALLLCEANQYQRAFDLARSALSEPNLVEIDKAYMHLILTQDATENEKDRGQAAYVHFRRHCLESPSNQNAMKLYCDARVIVLKGKKIPSEVESGPAPHNFISIDPRLLDPSLSEAYSSANNGTTEQSSVTRQDLQPQAQETMAQNSGTVPSANAQSAAMKGEQARVYTTEERKAITEKARSAIESIFADDPAGGAMVNETFFPNSLYEDTANRAKESQRYASQGVAGSQYRSASQGLSMPYSIYQPNENVNNQNAVNSQPFNASQSYAEAENNNTTFPSLGGSQLFGTSPMYARTQAYNANLHEINNLQSVREHGMLLGNQRFAAAQTHTAFQRGHASQGFAPSQHNLPSNGFAEPVDQYFRPQMTAAHGSFDSRSFAPAYPRIGSFQTAPNTRPPNDLQNIDPALRGLTGNEPLGEPLTSIANQPYHVTQVTPTHGGMVPNNAGTHFQGVVGTHGNLTSHGMNQQITGFNQSTMSQPYNTGFNPAANSEAATAHSSTAFISENREPNITNAEGAQSDMGTAMANFRERRCRLIQRFYGSNYRQTSYHDQGPTLGVVLTPTTVDARSEDPQTRDTEAGDTESGIEEDGNTEMGGMD